MEGGVEISRKISIKTRIFAREKKSWEERKATEFLVPNAKILLLYIIFASFLKDSFSRNFQRT